MQNQEKEKTIQEQLQEKLDVLSKITPESLVRTDDLGKELDFRDEAELFARTLKLFNDLKGVNLDDIPDERIQQLLNIANGATGTFENIQKFKSIQPDAVNYRNNLIQQVKSQYNDQFTHIAFVLAYAFSKGTDFEKIEGEAKATVSRVEEDGKKVEAASKQMDEILKEARKAAGEIGVAKYAEIFKKEADSHKNKALGWLIATAALAGITVFFGFKSALYYIDVVKDMNTPQAIQIGLSKLIILAVLYFGLVWAGKIYKAQQHNYVVNQHRNNALNTFTTFVKAAEGDDQTKSAILIQTTQAIFSPQHSGFTAHERELSASPQVLEILRPLIGGTKD